MKSTCGRTESRRKNKMHTTLKISCILALVVALVAADSLAATDISIYKQVTLKGPVVKLGDVAEVKSEDSARQQKLAAIPLMPAPAPGTQRYLRKREIQDLLEAHGENLGKLEFSGGEQVAITSPGGERTTVETDGANDPVGRRAAFAAGKAAFPSAVEKPNRAGLDEIVAGQLREDIRRTIVDYLNANTGRNSEWKVSINVADRHLIQLQEATTSLSCQGGDAPWTGKQRFTVSVNTAEGLVQVPIAAEVTLAVPVVVATRAIAAGAVITGADIEMRKIDNPPIANDRRMPMDSVEKLVGMEAAKGIQAGDVVLSDQVRSPILVKRGEKVTVITQGGGIRVRNTARVRQDGARGDLVQVESLETKERYDARVIGMQQVAVLAPTRPVVTTKPEQREATQWR